MNRKTIIPIAIFVLSLVLLFSTILLYSRLQKVKPLQPNTLTVEEGITYVNAYFDLLVESDDTYKYISTNEYPNVSEFFSEDIYGWLFTQAEPYTTLAENALFDYAADNGIQPKTILQADPLSGTDDGIIFYERYVIGEKTVDLKTVTNSDDVMILILVEE